MASDAIANARMDELAAFTGRLKADTSLTARQRQERWLEHVMAAFPAIRAAVEKCDKRFANGGADGQVVADTAW